jgi:hypothetical protein
MTEAINQDVKTKNIMCDSSEFHFFGQRNRGLEFFFILTTAVNR